MPRTTGVLFYLTRRLAHSNCLPIRPRVLPRHMVLATKRRHISAYMATRLTAVRDVYSKGPSSSLRQERHDGTNQCPRRAPTISHGLALWLRPPAIDKGAAYLSRVQRTATPPESLSAQNSHGLITPIVRAIDFDTRKPTNIGLVAVQWRRISTYETSRRPTTDN